MDPVAARPLSLIPFEKDAPIPVVEACLDRTGTGFRFEYRVFDATHVQLPAVPKDRFTREMGLWEHTCFECFIGHEDGPAYLEFNFGPQGRWNCFSFEGYRKTMTPFEGAALQISLLERETPRLRFVAAVTFDAPRRGPMLAAPCVILHCRIGKDVRPFHYAPTHPRQRPDFHHQACRIVRF